MKRKRIINCIRLVLIFCFLCICTVSRASVSALESNQADLTITQANYNINANGEVSLVAMVKNIGNVTYKGNVYISFYANNELIINKSVSINIAPQGTANVYAGVWFPPTKTTYIITAAINEDRSVPESNYYNNLYSQNINYDRQADYIIDDLSYEIDDQGKVVFTLGITNVGNRSLAGNLSVDYYIDGTKIASKAYGSSSGWMVDKPHTITGTAWLPPRVGEYTLTAVVNQSESFEESNYGNNSRSIDFEYTNKADYIIDHLSYEIDDQGKVVFTLGITNVGNRSLAGNLSVDYYIDGTKIASKAYGSSSGWMVDKPHTITGTAWLPPRVGEYTLTAVVNQSESFEESNYGNNSRSIDFEYTNKADYIIDHLSYEIDDQGKVVFTLGITNVGNRSLAGNLSVDYYIDGTKIASKAYGSSSGWMVGKPHTITGTAWLPPRVGEYTLTAVVNQSKSFEENNYGNNSRSIDFEYTNKADYIIDHLSYEIDDQGKVVFTLGITNVGNRSLAGNLSVDYYIDGTKIASKAYGSSSGWMVGKPHTITGTAWLPPRVGEYTLTAVVNQSKSFEENNYGNNIYIKEISVT